MVEVAETLGGLKLFTPAVLAGITILITVPTAVILGPESFPIQTPDWLRLITPPDTSPPPDVASPGFIPEAPPHFILNMSGANIGEQYLLDQLVKGGVIQGVDEISSVIVTDPQIVQEIKHFRMFGGIMSEDAQVVLQEAYNDRNDLGLGDKIIVTDPYGSVVEVIPSDPAAPNNSVRN